MPDGKDRENQTPQQPPKRSLKDIFGGPPAEPRITEPDPDYVPGSAPKPTPEEAQESRFREAAKKLAEEENDIVKLVYEYEEALPDQGRLPEFFQAQGDVKQDTVFVSSYAEDVLPQTDENRAVLCELEKNNFKKPNNVNLNTDIRLGVDKYYEYAQYYFDSNGDYTKILMGVVSQMTVDDFELAGSVLDGIKSKLLTALGKTPPQAPDQNSNTPPDSG